MKPPSDIHLLVTGDLHLGRHPSKIPEEFDSSEFSPIQIWNKIVETAINLEVDALIITGDIIDRDNSFYQVFGALESGIKKMETNRISVIVIAGNHDYQVLSDFSRKLDFDNYHFLGQGGQWENKKLFKKEKAVLNLWGWSYPQRHVYSNPLSELKITEEDIPTVACLHCELDNPGSSYVPLSTDQLLATGITGWCLGHIHQPDLNNNNETFILNSGSPQPLDPGEKGKHGIWDLKIKSKHYCEITQIPLASLKYCDLEIDVSSLETVEDLAVLISEKVREKLFSRKHFGQKQNQGQDQSNRGNSWNNNQKDNLNFNSISQKPGLIMLRISLTGKTTLCHKIESVINDIIQDLNLKIEGIRIIVEKIYNQTYPELDLEQFKKGNTPAALIADYLSKLNSGQKNEIPEVLVKQLQEKLLSAYNSNAYTPLRTQNQVKPPTEEDVYQLIEKTGKLLLETLREQKEG